MGLWFTADTHFNHDKMRGYMDRPFATVEEMNEAMIERWNSVVGPNHIVWHLGDFGFHQKNDSSYIEELAAGLNGRIHLCHGNHDDYLLHLPCWEKSVQFAYIKWHKQKIFLCHYAMRTWRGSHRGTYSLHGHSHGQLGDYGFRSMDVGVDAHNFTPIHFDFIHEKIQDKEFAYHHTSNEEKNG